MNIYKTYSGDVGSGRFTVALPFKYDFNQLGDLSKIAMRRFLSLKKNLFRF